MASRPDYPKGFKPTKHPTAIGSQTINFTESKGQVGSLVRFTPYVLPTVTALCTPTMICKGASATLTAGGADTYTWSTGATGSMIVVSPQALGIFVYSVTGEDLSGTNKAFVQLKVVFGPAPTITATSSPTLICKGEAATLAAGGANTYVWSQGGTGSNIAVSPSVSTTYTVKGTTDANGCFNVATVTQSVDPCTSIVQSVVSRWQLAVYPNPTNGEFNLESGAEAEVIVFNTSGQIVLRQKVLEGKNQIELKRQSNGIYFVEIREGVLVSRSKLIKQ